MSLVDARPRVAAGTAAVSGTGLALVAALATVSRPVTVLVVLVALVALAAMVLRMQWAVYCYVAIEPFGDLLSTLNPHAVKGVGALLFVAWVLRLLLDPRPVGLRHPGVYAAGALGLVLLASTTASGASGSVGVEVLLRYCSYLAVLAVLVDTFRTSRDGQRSARRVLSVYVASCTAAGVVGIVGFLASGGRAAGPLEDPNDFAFFLISAVPFAIWLARRPGAAGRLFAVSAVILVVATLTTFSRGGLAALVAMAVVGVALGLIRFRTIAVGLAAIAIAVLAVWSASADAVDQSLEEKQHVAGQNVDSRFMTWSMAAGMAADRPLLGHGPGGFDRVSDDYQPAGTASTRHYAVAHQMYLDIASELGLPGLAAFLVMVGAGVLGARRALRQPSTRPMASAVCVAFVGVLLAAMFLSEQYYLPVWLLTAVGISLDPGRVDHRTEH